MHIAAKNAVSHTVIAMHMYFSTITRICYGSLSPYIIDERPTFIILAFPIGLDRSVRCQDEV